MCMSFTADAILTFRHKFFGEVTWTAMEALYGDISFINVYSPGINFGHTEGGLLKGK